MIASGLSSGRYGSVIQASTRFEKGMPEQYVSYYE